MAINLTTKYASTIEKIFTHESYLKPHCKAKVDLIGAKSCRVYMLNTRPVVDYERSGTNRYGELQDVQDTVLEYTMTQDKAFNGAVDKGDQSEQAISDKSGQWLRAELREQCTPTADKYGFSRMAALGHVAVMSAAPAKNTVVQMFADAMVYMDEHQVPESGRVAFIRAADYPKIIQSDEWSGLDSLAGKQLPSGVVGQVFGFTVVKVPTSYFPENVFFLAAHETALAFPYKINDTKIHTDPMGVSGAVIEGRQTYDLFVLGSKADAVYVAGLSGKQQECTVAVESHEATVTAAGATEIWYTLDGSDPRFSANRKQVATGGKVTTVAGQTVRAVAFAEAGKLTSAIAEDTDE